MKSLRALLLSRDPSGASAQASCSDTSAEQGAPRATEEELRMMESRLVASERMTYKLRRTTLRI